MTSTDLVEKYLDGDKIQAIVIRSAARAPHITFVTSSTNSFQVGLMSRDQSSPVRQHQHNPVKREIEDTQEFLLVRKGNMTVRLYDFTHKVNHEIDLAQGDSILLCGGAHGIQFNGACELLEVKQGPYVFDKDKEYIEN